MEWHCGRRRESRNYENASTSKEADHTYLVPSPLLSDLYGSRNGRGRLLRNHGEEDDGKERGKRKVSILPNETVRSQWNYKKNGATLFDWNKVSIEISYTFAFRPKFWKRAFLEMKRQVSVGPERPVKEDFGDEPLWLETEFPRGLTRFIYSSPETFENFGLRESTPPEKTPFFCIPFSPRASSVHLFPSFKI